MISFGHVDSYAKTFLVSYTPFENSTTRIAILSVPNSFLSSLGGGSSTSPTTPDPGPQFLDSASNHTLVQTPVSSTTFLHCEVEDLRDFQV